MSAPGHAQTAPAAPVAGRGWVHRFLRTPLLTKLVVLDVLINLVALLVMQWTPAEYAEQVTLLSLGVVLVLNAGLVAWALRPLGELEETARRVSQGAFDARTSMPALADRNLVRIGDTLDALLDRVASERARVRALAAQVVATGDQERARIARELHDGTAQSLSALEMLLSSTLSDSPDAALTERLTTMRDIVRDALSEVRNLSHTVHPRVLDDLGLPAALEFLARRARGQSDTRIPVTCDLPAPLPKTLESVLYRVAQEAIHNAMKHGDATEILVALRLEDGAAVLEVTDDGRGFDRAEVDDARRGMGLFVMEERTSLVDGRLQIDSHPGEGTTVRAVVPLPPEAA